MKGKDVRRIRDGLDLTQSEFAKLLGVPLRTLQQWEQNRQNPGAAAIALLKRVADAPSRRTPYMTTSDLIVKLHDLQTWNAPRDNIEVACKLMGNIVTSFEIEREYQELKRKHPNLGTIEFLETGRTLTKADVGNLKEAKAILRAVRKVNQGRTVRPLK
jgi:transcriptional regulator with XRE-family HTH domain